MTATDVDLDALIDALAARAATRARPLVNAAGDEISGLAAAGLVTVNPGDLITSQWGNLTYGQTMLVFANVADRNNQWAAPADGAICYTVAEITVWCRRSGQWIALAFAPNKASCRYGIGGFTTSATPSTVQLVPFTAKVFDDANAYNTTTGVYTCPYPGVYQVAAQFGVNVAACQLNRFVYKNAAQVRLSAITTFGTGYSEMPVVFSDRCVAGDTLDLRISISLASVAIRSATAESCMEINYLGP